jgi:hypothetical protein
MGDEMNEAKALIDAYFDGWNAHDASAVQRTFAAGGTYSDPTTDRPVAGSDIARVVEPLCTAFPGVWTSVWTPTRMNRIWVRCPSCGALADVNDDHKSCSKCHAPMPERRTSGDA